VPLLKRLIIILGLIGLVYGGGRLYYAVTGGFTMSNITSDLSYQPKWATHSLSDGERVAIDKALDQGYRYLGKGCQSYVFLSNDGNYVIKFFKFQRFRPQAWIDLFTFIPFVDGYQQGKIAEKNEKLNKVFTSWKIAFEKLPEETGVVYVHLNKSNDLKKTLAIRDKMGFTHEVDLDHTEFLIQKRATMLCDAVDQMVHDGASDRAELLIDHLLTMLMLEYGRGYADNDHALMQNTGVIDGHPVHIDVGQFIYNETVKAPKVHKQELYDKTYLFDQWLKKHHPSLARHLEARLATLIGPDYYYSAPYVHKGDVAKIPHQEIAILP
jgi:hypothetical protein